MMTKAEFIARSGIPRQTLERWLRAGKIVPADFDDNNKPLFSDEQISAAKALHKPEHNPKKSVTAADRAQSLFEEDTPMDTIIADNINPADSDATPDADSDVSTDNTHDEAQHVAEIEIDRATFNTIMLHAEKIENGQADFVATLQRELNALTAAAPVFATADNLRDRVRNFLSQLPLIIRDDDRRYRLTKLAPNSFELDLIDATADDTQHVVEGEVSTDNTHADAQIDSPPTLAARADKIRRLSADVQRGIIEIGFELIAAKEQIGHGGWQDWLHREFQWTIRTAQNFMAIAQRFGVSTKNENVFAFKTSTLQAMLLLPPDTEQEFIDEQAALGRPVETQSAREVKAAVKDFKARHDADVFPTMDDVKLPTAPMEPTRRNQIAGIATYGGFDDDDDPNSENPDWSTSDASTKTREFISDAAITPATDDDLDDVLDGTQPADTPKYGRDNLPDEEHIAETIALKRAADFLRQAAVDTPSLNEFFNDLAAMCDRRQKN